MNVSTGVLAPRSITVKPRPRRRSAAIAIGTACWSPATAPMTMVPRVWPGRLNWGPKRPMRRFVTAVARCSSAIETSPIAHAAPMAASAGASTSRYTDLGASPEAIDASITFQDPASSPAVKRSLSRADQSTRSPEVRVVGADWNSLSASLVIRQPPPTLEAASLPVRTYLYAVM